MAGIAGIVNGGSPERTARALDVLIRRPQIPPAPDRPTVARGPAAFTVSPGATVVAAEGGVALAVHGRLYDPELADGEGRADPRRLLSRFALEGAAGLESLNGDYVIAVWEDGPRRLTLVNDRFGLRRLYYWAAGPRLAFSPDPFSFGALSGFPRTIDEYAVADYLALGHHLDGRTWYSAVRLLPPACVLTFSDGRLSLRRYWRFARTGFGDRSRGRDEGGHALDAALRSALRRRLPAAAPVEIAADDAGTLAGFLDEPWRLVPIEADDATGFEPLAGLALAAMGFGVTGACLPCRGARLAALGERLRDHAGLALTSHLADVLRPAPGTGRVASGAAPEDRRGRAPLGDMFREDRRGPLPTTGPARLTAWASDRADLDVARVFPAVFADEEIRQIMRPEVYRRVQRITGDTLARCWVKAPGDAAADRAVAVLLAQSQRAVSLLDVEPVAGGCRVLAPFADPEVVDAAQASPVSWRPAAPEPCRHLFPFVAQLFEIATPALGEMFRLPKLRELLGRHLESRSLPPAKLCVIAGLCLWLAVIQDCVPTRPSDGDDRSEGGSAPLPNLPPGWRRQSRRSNSVLARGRRVVP
jgi:hypothetical protein